MKQNYKRVAVTPETYALLEEKAKECNIPFVNRIVEILVLNFIDFIGPEGKIKPELFNDPRFNLSDEMIDLIIEKMKEGLKNKI